jgi:hypothetical protein
VPERLSGEDIFRAARLTWAYKNYGCGMPTFPPAPPRGPIVRALDDSSLVIESTAAGLGASLYLSKNCMICHGQHVVSMGVPAPDLRVGGCVRLEGLCFGTAVRFADGKRHAKVRGAFGHTNTRPVHAHSFGYPRRQQAIP